MGKSSRVAKARCFKKVVLPNFLLMTKVITFTWPDTNVLQQLLSWLLVKITFMTTYFWVKAAAAAAGDGIEL